MSRPDSAPERTRPHGRRGPSALPRLALALSLVLPLFGCRAEPPPALLGGQTTIHDTTPNAFGQPAPGLDREQELLFFVGNSFFNQNWVSAPASTEARDGLGPTFNARSCASCHMKDGRGRPPEHPDERGTGFLMRLSVHDRTSSGAHEPDPVYGAQIQDQGLEGVLPEARVLIHYDEMAGAFADGTPYSLRRPRYEIVNLAFGPLHPDIRTSPRVAPQMIGLGLLEAVPEADIVSRADPDDRDGDGISGRLNRVWDAGVGQTTLGRFGWKANQPTIRQQTSSAFLGDIGITTGDSPDQNCGRTQTACLDALDGGRPEIDDEDLAKVVLYASSLAVPAMRSPDDPRVMAGAEVFREIGCAKCHTPEMRSGVHTTLHALSNQTFHPYTDLLLHDMGEGLADRRPDFEATGSEWRTPPLWGIGLFETVNDHTYYLHDGRARNLTEAILWHGGEGEAAREAFRFLAAESREDLLRFLESL